MTTEKTELSDGERPPGDSVITASASERKPRLALFIATAGGLGYFPKAPGTFGSLLGVAFAAVNLWIANTNIRFAPLAPGHSWTDRSPEANFLSNQGTVALALVIIGVWAATRAANFWQEKDPQKVVIDEVSGQSITYLGILSPGPLPHSWIYLLAGFILFRVFDIWKPFPARQAESLPGGWGIMADDWIAGIYAAVVLLVLRHFGL